LLQTKERRRARNPPSARRSERPEKLGIPLTILKT
jgi:hypothetical protein